MTDRTIDIEAAEPGANWAGNHRYEASRVLFPASVDELLEVIRTADRPRAIGTRHTFNALPDTPGDLVSLARMPGEVVIDEAACTATVPAGLRYGDVATELEAHGWALHNLASLPHIGVAGAVATSTHGSGDGNGSLATAVRAVEFATAAGELVTITRGEAGFGGAVVSLGALGIATRVTLDIRPTYRVSQRAYRDLSWDALLENLDAVTGAAYSVSLFTDWGPGGIRQAWLKATDPADVARDDLFGALPSSEPLHMLPGVSPVNCTPQLAVPGPWHERLPHFQLRFMPSSGEEIQSEFLVARSKAPAAIEALRSLHDVMAPVLQGGEIRTMAADDLWLSGAYADEPGTAEGTIGFHFTWRLDGAQVAEVLAPIEDALAPFAARPHWGKVFLDRDRLIPSLYPRLDDFRALAERMDPAGRFRNDFLERHVFG